MHGKCQGAGLYFVYFISLALLYQLKVKHIRAVLDFCFTSFDSSAILSKKYSEYSHILAPVPQSSKNLCINYCSRFYHHSHISLPLSVTSVGNRHGHVCILVSEIWVRMTCSAAEQSLQGPPCSSLFPATSPVMLQTGAILSLQTEGNINQQQPTSNLREK